MLLQNLSMGSVPLAEAMRLLSDRSQNLQDHANIARRAASVSSNSHDGRAVARAQPADERGLAETLKLLFNLTQFYPDRRVCFRASISYILTILDNMTIPSPPLQPPLTHLINALLNLDLQDAFEGASAESNGRHAIFPLAQPSKHVLHLLKILEASLGSSSADNLEADAIPLLTLIRHIYDFAPVAVKEQMRARVLPSDAERDQPLGHSDSFSSQLLKLSTTPVAPKLKDGISGLMYEMSNKDSATFVHNVGYGFAAGYLMNHNLTLPEVEPYSESSVSKGPPGLSINPITGQRRDREPQIDLPEMTDEEKEREGERLFVLFERLKATGVVDIVNPVEAAAREGRFEELDD